MKNYSQMLSWLVLQTEISRIKIGSTSEETAELRSYMQGKCASSKEKWGKK
jgi:hypothetical protein